MRNGNASSRPGHGIDGPDKPDGPDSPAISVQLAGRLNRFSLDVSFTVPDSGVTAVFGPSGSGKTSVLRCIAGLSKLTGRIEVDGETWQDDAVSRFLPPHQRSVGYVFQEASLFSHLSVRENLEFGAKRSRRVDRARDDRDSPEAMAGLLGISHLLNRGPDKLSGGERQRVAIGRALLARPKLLLMDEPLSAVDRAAKDEIISYLEQVNRRFAVPIIYVSHDISEVARLADRMVLLAKGTVRAEGPVQELLERLDLNPATGRFEAGVIVTGTVTGHDPEHSLTAMSVGDQRVVVPGTEVAVGERVRLRIRARDVALATTRPVGISIRNILAGTISEIADEPGTAFAETLVDVGGERLRARITRAAVADLGLTVGQPVFALVKSIAFDGRALIPTRRKGQSAPEK